MGWISRYLNPAGATAKANMNLANQMAVAGIMENVVKGRRAKANRQRVRTGFGKGGLSDEKRSRLSDTLAQLRAEREELKGKERRILHGGYANRHRYRTLGDRIGEIRGQLKQDDKVQANRERLDDIVGTAVGGTRRAGMRQALRGFADERRQARQAGARGGLGDGSVTRRRKAGAAGRWAKGRQTAEAKAGALEDRMRGQLEQQRMALEAAAAGEQYVPPQNDIYQMQATALGEAGKNIKAQHVNRLATQIAGQLMADSGLGGGSSGGGGGFSFGGKSGGGSYF